MDLSKLLTRLLEAKIDIGPGILWREVIGNLFGLASAVLGMRRRVSAWPVGIIGNILLFTVFVGGAIGGAFATPQKLDMWGQAGRQVFFLIVSVYGWVKWYQLPQDLRRHRERRGEARLGRCNGRLQLLIGARRALDGVLLRAEGPRLLGTRLRRLDPDRLDPGDVRHGTWLDGVLVDLDRGRRRRSATAADSGLLPVGADVHRLRRLLRRSASSPGGGSSGATGTGRTPVAVDSPEIETVG